VTLRCPSWSRTPATDPSFSRGTECLLFDYVGLTSGETLLLVHDPRVEAVAGQFTAVAERANARVRRVSADLDRSSVIARLDDCDVALFVELDASHHTTAVLDYLAGRDCEPRIHRLFGATVETVSNGFRRSQSLLRRRNLRIIERALGDNALTVVSPSGTNLELQVDRTACWTSTCGECADGYPGVLPPAEINTRTADVHGVLVVDGAIASNLGWPLDARLRANPVTLHVASGTVTKVECEHKLVQQLIEEFLAVPGANEVVEIGIGTNDGIPHFSAADTLLNERYASFHLGVGLADARDPRRNIHIDFILGDCTITAGDFTILEHGRFAAELDDTTRSLPTLDVALKLHDAI
jgi:hypothetical protein